MNKKKYKIAVITTHHHAQPGGIATYNRMLYEAFPNHNFTEFPTIDYYKGKKNKNLIIPKVNFEGCLYGKNKKLMLKSNYSKKDIKKIYNEHDIVILSHLDPPKKYFKHKKSVYVQHTDKKYFSFFFKLKIGKISTAFGQAISSILFGNGYINNPFKHASNVVFFAKETSVSINGNSFYIPLPNLTIKGKNIRKKKVLWAARMDKVKNPKLLSKFIKKGVNIEVYAPKNNLSKKYKIPALGYIERQKLLDKMSVGRVFLVTSIAEGFIFTVVEALSRGMAVIVFNLFDAVSFFGKSDSVFVFEEKEIDLAIKKINELNSLSNKEFEEISNASYKFAKENFSLEKFKNEWEKVFEHIVSYK